MSNFLRNGTVLPHGLVGVKTRTSMEGFNKSYKNTALRMGIVVRAYDISDEKNLTKLTTEYDVSVFEQNENRGSTIITYKNCVHAEGMGSIPDFFEKTLRIKEGGSADLINTTGQNGAVVLIQCLDGMSDKAIIVGAITHPDRATTLVNTEPYLQGEYNGVNVEIANDGAVTLTFKGATDNDGNVTDTSQGNTVASIETDGSFQIMHGTITFRLDKNGTATLTTNADTDLNVTGNVNITAQGNAVVQCNDVSVNAQGKADIQTGADATIQIGGDCNATVSGKLVAQASEIALNGSTGQVLTTVTEPVIDSIFGQPTTGVPTVKAG